MPKKIPDIPKDFKKPTVDDGRSYEIELITPMFGGGVETRVSDPSFPIRPTAIRGQLQFWWRATVGARYATLTELRAAQTEVWGSTERASRVQVRVEDFRAGEPSPCAEIVWDPNAKQGKGGWRTNWLSPFRVQQHPRDDSLPYALFPFQGKPEDKKGKPEDKKGKPEDKKGKPEDKNGQRVEPAKCIQKASFRLTLVAHEGIDFTKQVEPALWAWANFGGLGGRTRRGCGAIACKMLAPKNADDLKAVWRRYMPGLFPQREWPTLSECLMLKTQEQPGDPIPVWDYVIGIFRHFRQGEGLGRNKGQQANRPGRSRYAEPETIRRIKQQRSSQHARLSQIPDDAFPRAELGLPIVFHFQGQGEPPDTVLYPSAGLDDQKRERMASPLIVKPLALENGKAIPLIMRLRAPSLTGVDLRCGDKSLPLPSSTVIRDARLSNYRDSPLAKSPNGSALEAFLAFARSEGFTEVTR